jgi:pyridoxal phosphate enzyme (YggS family)
MTDRTAAERTASVDALRAAHATVQARIEAAASRAGRDPDEVSLVAVSKTVELDRVRDALAAGLQVFGENRVQEGESKAAGIPEATWELIGPLQSNKVRRALETFDRIQTVDSVALAQRLDRIAGDLGRADAFPVLLQVNVDDDPAKAGFAPTDVGAALDEIAGLAHLRVDGLMTVGRLVDDAEAARPTFRTLRELSEGLRAARRDLGPALSMGMTDDLEVAIEEGATIVRVGRALFGERPHQHGDGAVDHAH